MLETDLAAQHQSYQPAAEACTAHWEEKLAELAAYKAMPGHCLLLCPQLGKWVRTQREQTTKYDADPATSQLTVQQMGKLWALGFT